MTFVDRIFGRLDHTRFAIMALGIGALIGALAVMDPRLPILLLALAVGGYVALSRPEILVPLLFLGIMMEASGKTGLAIAGLPLTLSKIAVLGMVSVWAIRSAVERRPFLKPLPFTGGMVVVAMSMVIGVGIVGSAGPGQIQTVLSFVMVCVMAHLIERMIPINRLSWLIRVMGITTIGIMLTQFSKSPVESALDDRYSGAFLDANNWAMILLLIAPLILAVYAEEKNRLWAIPMALFVVLLGANILQSLSRSGLITSLLVLPVILTISWRRSWIFLVALGLLPFVIGAFVSMDAMYDRYITLVDQTYGEADGSMLQRAELARTAWLLFRENMVFGVGQGHFIDSAMARTNGNAHLIAHNTYLNIAAELGLVGLAAHAFLFFVVVRQGVQAVFRAKTRRLQRLVLGYAAGMLSFALMSATLNNIAFPMGYFVLGLGAVICRATYMSKEELEAVDLGDPTTDKPGSLLAQAA